MGEESQAVVISRLTAILEGLCENVDEVKDEVKAVRACVEKKTGELEDRVRKLELWGAGVMGAVMAIEVFINLLPSLAKLLGRMV